MKKIIILLLTLACIEVVAQEVPASLGFTSINHLALQVKDMPASKEFYRNVIGLTPVAVPDSMNAIRGWFNTGNGQMIHLLAGRVMPVVNDKNGSHFAIFVSSITNAEKFLTEKKIPFHKQVRFDKAVQIYFSDPDGYLIEMNEKK